MSSDGAPRAKEIGAMRPGYAGGVDRCRRLAALKFFAGKPSISHMTSTRRLLGALACAAALLIPAGVAQAAVPGVNVTDIGYDGIPRGGWQNVTDSGARQIRGFVNWQNVRGVSRDYEMQRYRN